ncbi:MAG TPA: hypothetical protein VJ788_07195, partial [Gemmatimonadota bacterium]|nr:hypothetical protein [Gemmatimonadota bacterium]
MSEHPALERIVEWALGRGASGEIGPHLESCEACRGARAWAEALAAAIAAGRPGAAPEAVVERALGIPFEHPRPATRAASWSIARLVERAFDRPQLAGVRGRATGRRFLYAIDGGHVDLEIAPDVDDGERFRITAQVLFDEEGAPDDLIAILSGEGRPLSSASGDESGTFAFYAVAPGEYRIELIAPSAQRGARIGGVAVETSE